MDGLTNVLCVYLVRMEQHLGALLWMDGWQMPHVYYGQDETISRWTIVVDGRMDE
jgi:hypothetical protein